MQHLNKILLVFLLLTASCAKDEVVEQSSSKFSLEEKIQKLKNRQSDYVLVVSHRGNWRVAPENSLASIQSCIDLDVDIVEIDVRKTKDGHLVVIHDSSLDRTTNGSGSVSSKTLSEIKQLYLYDRFGNLTKEKVPTLKEAMQLAKNNIIVMIDKANDFFQQTHEILTETGTVHQALFLEPYKYSEAISIMSESLFKNSLYVPRIKENVDKKQEYIGPFLSNNAADAIEIRFSTINSHTLEVIPQIIKANVSIWITTLSSSFSAGYTDQVSLNNPDLGWGKCIDLGANVLMTDYPEQLIEYLTKNKLH